MFLSIGYINRNTNKTKSLLDIILTNLRYISEAGTLEHYISDHQLIYVVKKKKRDGRPNVEFKGRSFRNFDRELFKRKWRIEDWEEFYLLEDPNDAWDFILKRVIPILDQMCPLHNFMIKNYRPEYRRFN